jgi:hypothetical protein
MMVFRWLLFVVLVVLLSVDMTHAQKDGALLIDAGNAARNVIPRADQVGTMRSRYVLINQNTLTNHVQRGDADLVLNLFDGVTYTAVNTRIEPRPSGKSGYLWIGTLRDVPYSNVLLVVGEDILDGRILIPGRNYYIAPTATPAIHTVSEINTFMQRPTPDKDDAVVASPEMHFGFDGYEPPRGVRADNGNLIDVMIVYTPAAVAFVGGVANMEAAIDGTVALANLTYENSEVKFRLRLVHTEQVNYTERPFTGSDLNELTNTGDGYMDNVHALRNIHAADLVTLIAGTSVAERNYCGIAWLPTIPSASQGFSVVEALCISDITYAHELGHNMGSAHDRANGFSARAPYAYGYQDPRDNPNDWGDFVTVMAYSTGGQCPPSYQPGVCPAIAYWSNPDQTFNGKPLGYPDNTANATNNARSLDEVAVSVANYRVSWEGTELMSNGGFELDTNNDGVPDGWKGQNLTGDKRVCNAMAHTGTCAFRFKGRSGENSRLVQPLIGVFNIGDTLTLRAYVRSTTITGGAKIQLVVNYTTLPTDKATLPIGSGWSGYNLLSDSITLAGDAAKVKVIIRYNNPVAAGKFFVDNVSLRWITP